MNINEVVLNALARQCNIDVASIGISTVLAKGLPLDALDLLMVTMAIEDELNINIDDLAVDECTTVGDLIKLVAGIVGK